MAHERTCMICGDQYKYCPTCKEYNPNEPWRMLFHDEDCLKISKIWYAYRGREITKEQAKNRMGKYPDRLQKIFTNDSIAAKEIKDIFDIVEKKVEEQVKEQAAETVEETKPVEEAKPVEAPVSVGAKQSFKGNDFKNKKK